MRGDKLLAKALASPNNLAFRDLVALVEEFGFRHVRTSGSHHVYVHRDVSEPVNIQSVYGTAKPYQVRQFLGIVERNNLTLRSDL